MVDEQREGDIRSAASEAQSSAAPTWAGRLSRIVSRDDWLVIGWVLSIKVLLFVFGAKSFHILENKPLPGTFGWLDVWNRWDSLHYLQVARFGYNSTGVMKAWFYPLFPWCTRLVAYVVNHNYLVSAFIVSSCASVAAAILLLRIVRLDHDVESSRWAVWFFLIFPTAFYLHIAYAESLFLALVLGSILAAISRRWWAASDSRLLACRSRRCSPR